MILYSVKTDFIYDTAIHKVIPDDCVKITLIEKHEHMGNVVYKGKYRVKHTYPFVFKDIPALTNEELFDSAMRELNENHDKKMLSLCESYSIAIARDGSTETEKVKSIRAKIISLDDKYEKDQAELIDKFFGA